MLLCQRVGEAIAEVQPATRAEPLAMFYPRLLSSAARMAFS